MLVRALASLERADDDLSDAEHIGRQTDAYWYIDYCIEKFGRLPSEIDPILGMREFNRLRAYEIVKSAYAAEQRQHRALMKG